VQPPKPSEAPIERPPRPARRRASAALLIAGGVLLAILLVPLLALRGEVTATGEIGVKWRTDEAVMGAAWVRHVYVAAPVVAGALCILAAFLPCGWRGGAAAFAGFWLWVYEPLVADLGTVMTYHASLWRFFLVPLLPATVFLTAGGLISGRRWAAAGPALAAVAGVAAWIVVANVNGGLLWRFLAPLDEGVFYGKMVRRMEWFKSVSAIAYWSRAGMSVAAALAGLRVRHRAVRGPGIACGMGAALLVVGLMFAFGRSSLTGVPFAGLLQLRRGGLWDIDHLRGLGQLAHHVLPQALGVVLLIAGWAAAFRRRA